MSDLTKYGNGVELGAASPSVVGLLVKGTVHSYERTRGLLVPKEIRPELTMLIGGARRVFAMDLHGRIVFMAYVRRRRDGVALILLPRWLGIYRHGEEVALAIWPAPGGEGGPINQG